MILDTNPSVVMILDTFPSVLMILDTFFTYGDDAILEAFFMRGGDDILTVLETYVLLVNAVLKTF